MDRRRALCTVAGAGFVAAALAACSSGDDGGDATGDPTSVPTDAAGVAIANTADVAVGGGVVVDAPGGIKVVVVQPEAGAFRAFNAACTHQGTIIAPPDNGGIMTCPNHGSQFNEAGDVVRGPAAAPLISIAIAVEGEDVVLV